MRFLLSVLASITFFAPTWGGEPNSTPVDSLGDPLPAHAINRFGSTRWRQHWSIVRLGYSPDGKTLGAWSYEEGVCLHDAATGKRLAHVPIEYVPYGLFTFSGDVRWFARTKTENRTGRVVAATVEIFAADTGKQRVAINTNGLRAIALSPDGTHLATASDAVALWDAVKGTKTWQLAGAASTLKFHPDGKKLLVGNDKRLRIWDVATGKELRRIEGDAQKFALSQDGKTLATRGNNVVRIVDFLTGDERRVIPTSESLDARVDLDELALSSDGKWVALAGLGHLFAWETATGKEQFRRRGGPWHTAVAFKPASDVLTWGCMYEPTIQRWDLAADKDLQPAPGHRNHVQTLAFVPGDKTLISSGVDGVIRRWTLDPDRKPGGTPPLSTHEDPASFRNGRIAVTPDGKTIAVLGPGPDISLLDAASGKVIKKLIGVPSLMSIAFSPDGKLVGAGDSYYDATGRYASRAHIWSVATGEKTQFIEGHASMVRAVAFSPDSKMLATGADGIRLWDVANGKQVRRFLDLDAGNAIAFAPDGKTFVSAGKTAILWDTETGQPRHRLGGGFILAAAISPDGKQIATGGFDKPDEFSGASGLEQALLDRPELFVRTLTEKLLTFGLGRGVEYHDAPAIRQIVRDVRNDNFRFSRLILGIVNSPPFQMRKTR